MIQDLGVINDASPHIIADLFEIICFFERKNVSRGDIETYLMRDGGSGVEEELDIEADDGAASSAEVNERFQRLSEIVFTHFAYRQTAFGNWYPFVAAGDVLTLKPDLDDRARIYGALLAYSRLRMFSRSNRSLFAAKFEKLCVEAVKGMFPSWNVLHFGKGGADRPSFGTKTKVALRALAQRLKDEPIERSIGKLKERDTGDGGIDIVVIQDFSDLAPGIPAYFGQCAAQQDGWPEKRFEAHPISISQYIRFFHQPGTLLLIPLVYRNPDGDWVEEDSYGTILLDRLRLIQLLERRNSTDAITAAVSTIPAGLIPEPVAA